MKKIALLIVIAFATSRGSSAQVIASYEFAPSAFTADSSGNGNTLGGGSAVASSTTVYDSAGPTADSAYFDGTQLGSAPGGATTFVTPFDFSQYNELNFNFYAKDTGTSSGALFEYTFDSGAALGGFVISADPTAGTITVEQLIPNGAGTGYAQDTFNVTSIGSFQNYDVNIDNTTNGASHFTLSENGVNMTPAATLYQGTDLGTFAASNYLWIGQNDYNNSAFVGNLQDVTISAPEPSTWAMMFAGLVGLLALGRLRRRSAL